MNFEVLLKRLSPKLRRISRRLDGGHSFLNYDDLFQEAAVFLWEKWRINDVKDKTDSFLLQACFFHLKNYSRRICKKIDFNSVSLNEFIPGTEMTFDELLISKEALNDFDSLDTKFITKALLGIISVRERKVFFLCSEGFTTREIGGELGISHVMVTKIKNRIRNKAKGYQTCEFLTCNGEHTLKCKTKKFTK